jgi:hypothetical protein
VRDRAIIEFADEFYRQLFDCENVCKAYIEARKFLDCHQDKD